MQAVMTDGALGDAMSMADPPKIRVVVRTRPLSPKVCGIARLMFVVCISFCATFAAACTGLVLFLLQSRAAVLSRLQIMTLVQLCAMYFERGSLASVDFHCAGDRERR
jgi:hypothetical protein